MTNIDCTYDTNLCLVCPQIQASSGHPAEVLSDLLLGWNAGANSVTMLDGDLYVADSIDTLPAGILLGLKSTRIGVTSPELVEYGLYVYPVAGQAWLEIRERGVRQGAAVSYTLGTLLEIRREAGHVSYWAGGIRLQKSTVRSQGPLLVNACLYSAGDTLP